MTFWDDFRDYAEENGINKAIVKVDRIRSYQTMVYKRGHKSFRKQEYKDYINEIALQLGKLKSIEGKYALKLTFISRHARVGDIDNLVKPISDILEMTKKVKNDRDCVLLQAELIIDKSAKTSTIVIQTQKRKQNE